MTNWVKMTNFQQIDFSYYNVMKWQKDTSSHRGNKFEKSYYRIRIIISFTVFTVILVVIISMVCYSFLRALYLNQLAEQVNTITQMISRQIPSQYTDLLSLGLPTKSTENTFRKIFLKNLPASGGRSEIFIFDKNYKIVVNSDSSIPAGTLDSRLLLNQKEISGLHINQGIASLPFRGSDGKWYLWGFYRLDADNWLAVRENASRFQKVENFSTVFWFFGLGGALLAIIIGWLMARSVTKPLNKLVTFSKELGGGNFQAEMPSGMKGEIGVLAKAMSLMRNKISEDQKEKENMLAQIAHEIRNPLGGIELLAGLAKEDLTKEKINIDPVKIEESSNYLDRILKEVHRLKSLIVSYLNFSRPSTSSPQLISPKNIVDEVINIYQNRLNEKNINITIGLNDDKIFFDPAQLKQVLMNLLSNSIESVSTNGKIEISSHKNEKYWQFAIRDDGPGIPEKNLHSIFNPFFTSKKNGTGLGLSICKKLCDENKTDIFVQNNEEKDLPAGRQGCTFILRKAITNEE